MEMWLGPSPRGSTFSSDDERRAAWLRHRDRLMAMWGNHGKRPDAWWRYEAPIPRPRFGAEQSALYDAGLLTQAERAELCEFWREEFTRCQQPNFRFVAGPDEILDGEAARRAHLRWSDVPRRLVRDWTVKHRRRERTIRRLAASASEPAA
jgi:hypothetical protein